MLYSCACSRFKCSQPQASSKPHKIPHKNSLYTVSLHTAQLQCPECGSRPLMPHASGSRLGANYRSRFVATKRPARPASSAGLLPHTRAQRLCPHSTRSHVSLARLCQLEHLRQAPVALYATRVIQTPSSSLLAPPTPWYHSSPHSTFGRKETKIPASAAQAADWPRLA